MADRTVLEFRSISKSYGGVQALQEVTLSLSVGSILGLVGENGAGKTTLMNILGGVIQPDSGQISLEGREYRPQNPRDAVQNGVAFIHQELNLFNNLTVAENILIDRFPRLGPLPMIDRRKMAEQTLPLIRSLDLPVSPGTRVEVLSPGERQLVEICKALGAEARIIIFDEPTTSLTAKETRRLFDVIRKLKDEGRSVIYISHILGDVVDLADEVAVLRDGHLVAAGPKIDYPIPRMISLMVGREIGSMYPARPAEPGAEVLLSLRDVSQPGIVRDISLDLHRGEVLGLFGLMGSGRSELARIIFGIDPMRDGEIRRDGAVLEPLRPLQRIAAGMAFVTENRREEGLLMEVSVAENLALVSLRELTRTLARLVDRRRLVSRAAGIKDALSIRSGDIEEAEAKSLSGGNQQKVVIGKWLMSRPEVLILDEPTRGIDVGAKHEVYEIVNRLAGEGTGVLMISSELEELVGMCDRVLVMSRGELTGEFARGELEEERILAAAFREGLE